MPIFLSDEEFSRCSHDGALVAEKADSYIRDLFNQLETVKAQADAASITAEQTCSMLEQKYVSLSGEFSALQSQNEQLNASLDQRLAEIAQLQAEKRQTYMQSIEKDGEIERLNTEASEFHKSKRQLLELLEQKDIEISEKNVTMKSYLDKIVNLTENAATREAKMCEAEAEVARSAAHCSRLLQEKELIERHNVWLNDELTAKINSFNELRRAHNELEADMSSKLADAEKQYNQSLSTLERKQDRVKDLESQLKSLQEDLCSTKEEAASAEKGFQAEVSTLTKLVDLYKESVDEWSKKAGELEAVIKALEIHSSQVENDYKEKLDNEVSAKKELEKEVASLKEKLNKCEVQLESARSASEMNLIISGAENQKIWVGREETSGRAEDNLMLVPSIPAGVSGTALAASLLRDGWSLAKMYAKYQEAVDALRHEELGRKEAQAIMERVLYEIEEKAGLILDERAEHERLMEAYSAVNQKLQHSQSEQNNLEKTILDLKADLKRRERDFVVSQKEVSDLQKQVAVLLKECRDIQLRCGSVNHDIDGDAINASFNQLIAESDAQRVISERLVTFKDMNGLVEQNTQLRSLVRRLSDQIENREAELKENFQEELQKRSAEAASRVDAVLARAEEQQLMIESLHGSVALYKKLYEDEQKHHSSSPSSPEALPESRRNGVRLLQESSQEAVRKVHEQASARVRSLEEDLAKLRSELVTLRMERDKMGLEAKFAQEKLHGSMKEFQHQRADMDNLISRNIEFQRLLVDYQQKVRESSDSIQASEELSRKLSMEVSVLKQEKETLLNSEKRASDEVRSLSERIQRLQVTLETIQSAEEVREEARASERRKQEEYIKRIEREWAEAKKDLQQERDNARTLRLEREGSLSSAMKQVEDMGKELANALHAVATAESKAAVAEARLSDLEKRIKSSEIKVTATDGHFRDSSDEQAVADLQSAREEIVKLKEEVQSSRDHMLQYKGIAQVNESALKQMEAAHENFKVEADKLKKALESEILSLQERVYELEAECNTKRNEAASAAARQEEVYTSSMSEVALLKEENSSKMSQITILEAQLLAMKDSLEEQQQKWRTSQNNYERQVILQSETIQELTKTSQALASLQKEASDLRNVANLLKAENSDLKVKWETEKLIFENSKSEAEKKYNELNEQNVILHSRLEALHIKFSERERGLAGNSSSNVDQDFSGDAGLQNVVKYLRRSKEIAETEISLLKQEKFRLQSQLESAIKSAEMSQATLRAERANSRALLYTDEEFKSLQLQVREMNLLRESNAQLREENKLNFDECQKLRETIQKARTEVENLEKILAVREDDVAALKKDKDILKMEKEHLERRVDELLERCHNISVEEYDRMREDVQQMQLNLKEKDSQLQEIKRSMSDKEERISHLEQELERSRAEIGERERRVAELLKVEASLKSDAEKYRKMLIPFKRKSESLSKEKESLSKEKDELTKENQALSKQLEDSKQAYVIGKRATADAPGEQTMREKEKEKDTRIQMLEKMVDKMRETAKKQSDEYKLEKSQRIKTQNTIKDLYGPINQEKKKLEEELTKHKHALKIVADEVQSLKQGGSQSEGTSAVQVFSGNILDEMATAYLQSVENFEQVAQPIISEVEHPAPADSSVAADTLGSGSSSGQQVPLPASGITSQVPPLSGIPLAKTVEERERRVNLTKQFAAETRKAGRKLVRPRIVKPEEPPADIEMSEVEEPNNGGKPLSSQNIENQGNPTLSSQPATRKRLSTSDLQEEAVVAHNSNTELPLQKRSKGSDFSTEGIESQSSLNVEIPKVPSIEASVDATALPHGSKEEASAGGKDESELVAEQAELSKPDGQNEVELQNEITMGEEVSAGPSDMAGQDNLFTEVEEEQLAESGSDREEGELGADAGELEGDGSPETEGQDEEVEAPVDSPDETVVPTNDDTEAISSQVGEDIKNEEGEIMEEAVESLDRSVGVTDLVTAEVEQIPTTLETGGKTSSTVITGVTDHGSIAAPAHDEGNQASPSRNRSPSVEQVSPANRSSTTIHLSTRAREMSALRQRPQPGGGSTSVARGRGRVQRGRVSRSFRGRGPSGQQG
ncbi:nuclear-pore anchor isoform X3 [Daucus carota subsp. sativus]|uniref:nuclear-pore anchor isoform X3 n=1 Tax=Daucus carota subsp. sativus TaxID=79200 RepID=UPI0007EF06A5|nr:PREDICTED: nuclear-pore anchor isoform X3 [Daucus carota subsp. sativus]